MDCKKCARTLPDDAILCCYCGARQVPTQKKSRRRGRGNGSGSVFRYRGKWAVELTIGWDTIEQLDGRKVNKRIYKRKEGFATAKEADTYLAQLRVEPEQPTSIMVKTVSEMYDAFSETAMLKLGKGTQSAYRTAYNKRINPAIGSMPITAVSLDHLDKIVAELSYDPAKDVRDLMSKLFQRAMGDGLVTINPTKLMTMPEQAGEEVIPWDPKEVELLWKAWGDNERVAGLCLLMIYSGMMPGEMLKLRPSMINWETNTIIGCGLKTKKRKEVPIVFPIFIEPVLRELCATIKKPDGLVVGMNKDLFYEQFKTMKEHLGIRPEVRPYSSRHSTGTELALKGVAPAIIVEIMRHKNYTTTLKHYTQIPTEKLVEALNSLQAEDSRNEGK